MKQVFVDIYSRDIDKLKAEISMFKDEAHLWQVTGSISNAAGNLCLHLAGNLCHFIGLHIGKTPYERNREAEFSLKDIPVETLISKIDHARAVVIEALEKMQEEDLEKEFPLEWSGEKKTIGFMLVHLSSHLSYHLGQINYLRRMFEKGA